MSQDNPILNRPYEEPKLHYRTLSDGSLDYTKIVKGRRPYDPTINTPIPVKQGAQGSLLDQQHFPDNLENHLINLIRKEVNSWRSNNYESPAPTRVTKELLNFWFNNPDRQSFRKLFFAQQEAVETAIWLNEIADKTGVGKSILSRLQEANMVGENASEFNLPRIAFKMATGTGKTVVMAMLILYHYFNRKEYRGDTRFADYFLIVAPGITIKDRLGVLYVDTQAINFNDAKDYYHERGLVPAHFEKDLPNINSRLVIANYHAFELRNIQGNKRSPMDGKIGEDGKKREAKEDGSLMIKRVLGKFRKDSRLLIMNDEAHHCYLPKQKGKGEAEAKDENARAAVWVSGLAEIAKKYHLKNIYDLSATPYYLNGSGYEAYSIFPWVVSDFGLIEAIESGLVKIPFLPESDTTHAIEMPVLRNLYEHVKDELPKKGKSKQEYFGEPHLPTLIKNALDQFVSHYKKDFQETGDLFKIPPVFIVVCNNTNVSSEIYKYIAGYDIHDDEGKISSVKPGHFDLLSNYDPVTRKPKSKPPTLLIDSYALEESDQVDNEFKSIFATEIELFKREYRITHPDKSADNITDAIILREVLNTVGKPGRLGSHIRCVVSVNMLTEGWDANTVTHIMGVRAFGSQLLCEQVAGRALRRKSYALDKDGKFPPEYAHIIGVPFKLFKGGKTIIVSPVETTRIQALEDRLEYEILFPQLIGYRVESAEKDIVADFSKVKPYEINGAKYPKSTTMGSAFLDQTEELTLEQILDRREQELIYVITKYMLAHNYRDEDGNLQFQKFTQIRNIVEYWLRHKTKCIGDAFINMLFYENPKAVCDHIMLGIHAEQRKHDKIMPIFNYYNKFGSTKYVNNNTSKNVYKTKKSHVNYVVADTDSWEQIATKTLEEMKEVICFVKNSFLGFNIPYMAFGKDRNYQPDFIVRCQVPNGAFINLILEISGFNQEKDEKKQYVLNRWLPAVNNVLDALEMDEWHFLEIAGEIRDIKNQIRKYLSTIKIKADIQIA